MKRLINGTLILTALFFAIAVDGHHAAAGIDRSKTVTIEGTVKQFKWGNPHSWLDLEVSNGRGGVEVWSLEMTSPAFLVRAGWKATTLKPGDKVTVAAQPMKNGDPGGLFISVKLPDGRTLTERPPAAAPAPAAAK